MLRLEHIDSSELPTDWLRRAGGRTGGRYTVILVPETPTRAKPRLKRSQQPLVGLWKDRADMGDVAAYVRELRKPRY